MTHDRPRDHHGHHHRGHHGHHLTNLPRIHPMKCDYRCLNQNSVMRVQGSFHHHGHHRGHGHRHLRGHRRDHHRGHDHDGGERGHLASLELPY